MLADNKSPDWRAKVKLHIKTGNFALHKFVLNMFLKGYPLEAKTASKN